MVKITEQDAMQAIHDCAIHDEWRLIVQPTWTDGDLMFEAWVEWDGGKTTDVFTENVPHEAIHKAMAEYQLCQR